MVTKGYMLAWANKKNVVDVIDLESECGYPSSVVNATVVSYVYNPAVMTHDLEGAYGGTEAAGPSAFARLRTGQTRTPENERAVIAFLDMHLHRGLYAARSKVRGPALVLKTDGTVEHTDLSLGDALILSRELPETLQLAALGLEERTWQIQEGEGLYTGDGAVLVWRNGADPSVSRVAFPLSPTQLLVIGDDLEDNVDINRLIVENCRRWIVGQRGTLPLDIAPQLAKMRRMRDRSTSR